jgi:Ser/Thr protein kinase RdoA (MazF antagonist)
MDSLLLSSACTLYNTTPDELIPLSGGHYNAVYQFPLGDKFAILRIGIEDCPVNQTLGMLEWVNYLVQQGAPVSAPITSINNHLLERLTHYGTRYILTAFEKADGILAENIRPSEWSDELFHSIGRAAGKMHHISASYHPSRHSLTRPKWFDSYEIHDATAKLASTTDPAREKLANLINELQQLPTSPTDFALIHDDLHFANFLIQPNGEPIIIDSNIVGGDCLVGQSAKNVTMTDSNIVGGDCINGRSVINVTIIDFDDCAYGWFAMDVAMALFDVLVLYNPSSEADSQHFARVFLSNYLNGYRQENDLSPFWQSQIPKFLKLKELCIYATLIGHADISLPATWVGRFMRGRAEHIASDLPYVNIDFGSL